MGQCDNYIHHQLCNNARPGDPYVYPGIDVIFSCTLKVHSVLCSVDVKLHNMVCRSEDHFICGCTLLLCHKPIQMGTTTTKHWISIVAPQCERWVLICCVSALHMCNVHLPVV